MRATEVEDGMNEMGDAEKGKPPGLRSGLLGDVPFLCSVGMADGGVRLWVAVLDRSPDQHGGGAGHVRALAHRG